MPPETTTQQFQQMLQNLIGERFQLKFHNESKQITGYSLVVSKGGIKAPLARPRVAEDSPPPIPGRGPRQMGPDGFPIPPPRIGPGFIFQSVTGDRVRMIGQAKTMPELALELGPMLDSQVVDVTGLSGAYDLTISFAGRFGPHGITPATPGASPANDAAAQPPADSLPDLFSALQFEVGLKLEAGKIRVEVMVVDHMEKVPRGN